MQSGNENASCHTVYNNIQMHVKHYARRYENANVMMNLENTYMHVTTTYECMICNVQDGVKKERRCVLYIMQCDMNANESMLCLMSANILFT